MAFKYDFLRFACVSLSIGAARGSQTQKPHRQIIYSYRVAINLERLQIKNSSISIGMQIRQPVWIHSFMGIFCADVQSSDPAV